MAARKRKTNLGSRHGARASAQGGGTTIYVLGAIVAVGLLAGAIFLMNSTKNEMAVDPETLCPAETGPLAETVVLFDVTDPLSVVQSNQLMQFLESEFTDAPVGTQFTMGIVSEDPSEWVATAPLCKPRSEKDVSSLTQNVTMVKARYQERFLAPLEQNVSRMISASGSNSSPIMESLQAVIASTPGFLTFEGPRKVILVSDLLQHSDAMSFYRGEDWQAFSASPAFQRLGRTLDGVQIKIVSVPRVVAKIRDAGAIEDFWVNYFGQQGAQLLATKHLGDL